MNYFHTLVLASLATLAVSSSNPPSFLSSSLKGKRGLYELDSSDSAPPETLYRHQLEPYKSQTQVIYQRSVPQQSQHQNLAGRPQHYYQQEAQNGGPPPGPPRYYQQAAGPPPSGQVKYYAARPQAHSSIQYNRPQIQGHLGKPSADGYQPKIQYAKAPQYQPQQPTYQHQGHYIQNGAPAVPRHYPVQYQPQEVDQAAYKTQQVQYQRPQQAEKPSQYEEQAQKLLQEAIQFQKTRLRDATSAFDPHPQFQAIPQITHEQLQQRQQQHQQQQQPQHQQHSPQPQQYVQQHRPQRQPAYHEDYESQQSEPVPDTAEHFYNQYLQMVNKQGFVQAPLDGEGYQQQEYQNLEPQQSQIQESYERPTKFLASGQVLNYKESDLQGI